MQNTRSDRCCDRSGVTIIEVLVVAGILGLLAALLIPAVQQSRRASRRATCQNHLRQIGIGIASIAESTGVFPTSQKPEPAYYRLLPHLDAAAVRTALLEQRVPENFQVPTLACPEDAIVTSNMAVGDSSYFFNDGIHFRIFEPMNGFRNSRTRDTRPSDVSDGLSNTVAMAERLVRPLKGGPWTAEIMDREPRRFLWWTETRYSGRGEEDLAAENCRNHRTTTYPLHFGANAMNYRLSYGYDHILAPNQTGCYNGPEDFDVDVDLILMPASSLHAGGVNVLVADGSVRFVADGIDLGVWRALGTRNGNESVAAFPGH
ncbi:MAG TPA: DUF1559 domain-containing protein [Planctomycetaceae bacterium]|nr:DUF1559 domain-containing protein [Planctomycetaceae bacterium SH412]HTN04910.1 DUF1559 domain-containing protein [Planctomycetaceae bacterium]